MLPLFIPNSQPFSRSQVHNAIRQQPPRTGGVSHLAEEACSGVFVSRSTFYCPSIICGIGSIAFSCTPQTCVDIWRSSQCCSRNSFCTVASSNACSGSVSPQRGRSSHISQKECRSRCRRQRGLLNLLFFLVSLCPHEYAVCSGRAVCQLEGPQEEGTPVSCTSDGAG